MIKSGNVFRGIRFWFRGVGMFFKHPRLLIYLVVPLILNFLLLGLFFFWGFDWVGDKLPDVQFQSPEGIWWHFSVLWGYIKAVFWFLWSLINWGLVLLLFVIFYVILFVFMATVVGSPFYDRMSLQIEQIYGSPPLERPFEFKKDVVAPIKYTIKMSLFQSLAWLFAFFIGFIPLIGQVLSLLIVATSLPPGLIAYCFERRLIGFREQIKHGWHWRNDYLGFGLISFVMMAPFGLAVITLPLSVAGATLLFIAERREFKKQKLIS